jgi:glycerophosphoryl diester phosphodiesterase
VKVGPFVEFLFQLFLDSVFYFLGEFRKWKPVVWPEGQFKLPLSQVHRGFHLSGIQENTLEAFREAKKRGAEMIELDVQLSKDNIPVVFHDSNLDRWCKEKSLLVCELSAFELKQKVNAPSLQEVLRDDLIPKFINIELKQIKSPRREFAFRIAEVVNATSSNQRVLFSSFDPLLLRAMGKQLPNVLRALLITKTNHGKPAAKWIQNYWAGGVSLCHMINVDQDLCTEIFLQKINKRKIPFAVWTVNNLTKAQYLRSRGALSIISDQESI